MSQRPDGWDDPEPVDVTARPLRAVLLSQRWCDLAFLHWFVPPDVVRGHLPAGTRPDVVGVGRYAGLSPVALVPFRMVGSGLGTGPAVPYLGTFWETNVRLYSVDALGRRGVVFASLDASRLAVVVAARLGLGLPYRWSRMRGSSRSVEGATELAWTTRTRWPGPAGLRSSVVVRVGEPFGQDADDHGLAAFLTARWGLHTRRLRRTWYLRNQHATWSLRHAELLHLDDQLLAAAGFPDLARRAPDHVAFSAGVRTEFGLPRR
jgi:uncharacterized protein YqjF (DUF2071 family)